MLRHVLIILYLSSFLSGTVGQTPPPYSKDLESGLRALIFNNYEVNQRPRKLVTVRAALNLLSLNELNIKEQKMSIAGYFHFAWLDRRLRWDNLPLFTNVKFMFTTELDVWTPAIIIENSVDDIDIISRPKVPMRMIKFGMISWLPGGIFTTHCESDVTYWPLDTQKCDVVITSWGYTANEVQLEFDKRIFITDYYHENGEWELLATNYSTKTTEREFESFSRLIFTVTYRRRPLFHMLNTLFPVILMGFLTVAIFKLNPESGERVGLALTILLAYAVYLSLISESIPQTSISASLLSSYLASILLLQTLAVFLTVLYLDIYFRPADKPVSGWLQTVASSCLARLVCIHCRKHSARVTPQASVENQQERPSTVFVVEKRSLKSPAINDADTTDVTNDVSDEEHEYSWKEIALMLDKITMYIYLVLVCTFTGLVFGIMLYHYYTAYTLDII